VQVDPIKPTVEAPGSKLWKLNHDKLLSISLQFRFNFASNFNLRRYMMGRFVSFAAVGVDPLVMGIGPAVAIPEALRKAGATMSALHRR